MHGGPAISDRRGTFPSWVAHAWALWLLLGCREPGTIALPPLPPVRDAAASALTIPDGATPCAQDSDCDDGVDCTKDFCLPGGYCVRALDSSRCSDGIFCNGPEVCDPVAGCMPSSPERCDDGDVCTVDRCDETMKACVHGPRDFDGDGEADWHCPGGTDCDDFDPNRGSLRPEICGNGIDDDCDDLTDEADCSSAAHDRCDDALDVSAGGKFAVNIAGAVADYAISCGDAGAPDVAFSFTLTESRDVELIASGVLSDGSDETAAVALRDRCEDVGTERKCSRGFPAQLRMRALAPGTYFAIVSSQQSMQVVLQVSFMPPSAPPTNTTCDAPLDISAGGRFEGNFVDAGDDEQLACGFAGAEDLAYVFTTDAPHDVELSATSLSGGRMSFAVRSVCHDDMTTLRCVSDDPARARLYQLPAGTYYVVLEGPPSREVDFSLEVAFVDPSAPPPGDGCSNPLELPLGMSVPGTLANRQDLLAVSCGCGKGQAQSPGGCNQFLADVVYHVIADRPTDFGVRVDGGSALMVYDFRSTCDAQDTQLACGDGAMVNGRIRNLAPGDYYLVLESPSPANDPASFTVEVDRLPRTVPVAVQGNETCATAYDVPSDGGLFSGDTLGMLDDYQASCGSGAHSPDAVYHLTLNSRSRVTASLEASFDTVLYRFTGTSADACQSKMEAACNDDGAQGNTNSSLSETLQAGSYYYVVDGFNDNNAGRYLLDIAVAPQ
ncbi:MAG: hypothetical protein ACHQ53_11180 [Polyangiales bacterium]